MALFSRSWRLFKSAWQVLRAEKSFFLYPAFAAVLVVPLLAAKDLGPITAIRESATLVRKTWGEQLTGSFGIGAAFGLLMLLVVIATFGLAGLAASPGRELPVVSIFAVGTTLFALLAVISSALFGIFRGAVYLYADKGQVAPQFDRDMITQAFAPKG